MLSTALNLKEKNCGNASCFKLYFISLVHPMIYNKKYVQLAPLLRCIGCEIIVRGHPSLLYREVCVE